jgi:ABC-type multidrug transport system permease subunit
MVDAVAGGGVALQTIEARRAAVGLAPDPALIPGWIERYGAWYIDFQRALFHAPERAALVLRAPAAGDEAQGDPFRQMMALTMTMLSLLRESEEGTLARLFTTPTGRTQILAGKFVAVFVTVLLQGMVLLLAGRLAFGIRWGTPGTVALALLGQVVAAAGLGVLLIAFVKSTRQGGPVLGGGLTVLGMLGGLFTANIPGGMPAAFDVLANFTPQGWVLKIWRVVLDGRPTADLVLPLAVTVAIGLLMFAAGAVLFRRRYA